MKLKALIQPACFAGAISWLAFVVAIFMGHENGDNKVNQEATHARYAGRIRACNKLGCARLNPDG